MKRNDLPVPTVAALSIMLVLALAACSKSNNSGGVTTEGNLSATTGSASFSAISTFGVYSQSLGLIGVVGYTNQASDTTQIQLDMAYIPPVNKSFSSDTIAELGLSYQIAHKRYDAFMGQGSVTLSLTSADTVNHQIAGTFSGVVYNDTNVNDSVIITNGKFSTIFTVSP